MSLQKKQKIEIPNEVSFIIGYFFGMSGSSVKGYLQTYRDAQRLTLAARDEFMTGAVGSNVRWAKAYAKECKARKQLKLVL